MNWWSAVKRVVLSEQDSLPGLFNWKDAVHTLRIAAVGAVALAGVSFLKDVDRFDFGLFDKLVADAVLSAVVAIEAWKANNS